ncbi:unnamed protein product [Discosporangium mesarthrocarpum]
MAGRSSRRKGEGSERIKALVEDKLAEGLQYEALQLYRGLVSRKSSRGDHDGAAAAAEQGIGVLIRGGVVDSATELGNVLVGIYADNQLPVTEERLDVIKRVNETYEDTKRAAVLAAEDARKVEGPTSSGGGESGDEIVDADDQEEAERTQPIGILQIRFLKQAVAWTARRGKWIHGDPGICTLLGRCFWGEGKGNQGIKYLVLGEKPQELCDILWEKLPKKPERYTPQKKRLVYSPAASREVAITQGALHFAAMENLRDANALQEAYKQRCPKGDSQGPLPTFCRLLLKTCEYDAAPVFQKLVELYKPSLEKEPSILAVVETIAKKFFGIQMRPPSALENIMGMLSAT